jgi:hypothetical protein
VGFWQHFVAKSLTNFSSDSKAFPSARRASAKRANITPALRSRRKKPTGRLVLRCDCGLKRDLMFVSARHPFPAILLLLAFVAPAASCGSSSRDEGQGPAESGGSSPASPDASSAGAPMIGPSTGLLLCQDRDVPGAPCQDERCYGTRCGVRFDLLCENGAWSSAGSSLAWELVCPSAEPIFDIAGIEVGACCAEHLARNDLYTEPQSCELCPPGAPVDGEPCSLPDDCAPAVIDCFYKCCCYGNTTWAQCDGERWHVATNCSPK